MREHLEKLRSIKRKRYNPLTHKIHKQYGISRKTLLYIREYGPNANIPKTIISESIKILLFASILSSLGGLALEYFKTIFISIVPLIVLLPALNDMIGDYGTIASSRFSTLLHKERIKKDFQKSKELKRLFIQILLISILTALISSIIALIISSLSGYTLDITICYKIFFITILDVISLVTILFSISIFVGSYLFKKGEDPDNFLIPITTSIADFGNIIILTCLVLVFF